MKITSEYDSGFKREVDYFGLKIEVPTDVKCVAVDADGEVWAYTMVVGVVESYDFFGSGTTCDCYYICDVDLEGMDWRDTLMEIE